MPSDLADPFEYCALPKSAHSFRLVDGVFRIYEDEASDKEVFPLPGNDRDFFTDMLHLCKVGAAGPMKTYCHHRLALLEQKFNLHVMLNADKEYLAQKVAPHRDFYNVRKVSLSHHHLCMDLTMHTTLSSCAYARTLRNACCFNAAVRICAACHVVRLCTSPPVPGNLVNSAGGHTRASLRVHAPEAPAAFHQEQAQEGAWRNCHLP